VTKLQTSNPDPTTLTNQEIVGTLLVESGASRRLPTDEHRVLEFLGLEQLSFDFMHELDFLESQGTPRRDLRAALSLNDRLVAVQSNLSDKRSRFSVLHEVAHFILPDHRKKLFLDDDETLSWSTRARLEREANQVAADLLFQGPRFIREAIDQALSWQTVLRLAPTYGASYEAAGRRFTEGHVLPCALLVYDKFTKTNEVDFEEDVYRLQYTITSDPFRKEFFRNLEADPNKFTASELYKPKFWGEITESELMVGARDNSKWRFETEVFSNGYKIFQFIRRPKETR
jgi:Zn-dependent peptidase ImmA (M78 family)